MRTLPLAAVVLAAAPALAADPNAVDASGNTPLLSAARWGETAKARELLEQGATVDAPRSPGGRTPLMVAAAYYAKPDLVKLLLDKGADPNAADKKGLTALMLAAQFQKIEIVELLLAKGADKDLKDREGKTALDYANASTVDDGVRSMLKDFRLDKEAVVAALKKARPAKP